MTIKYTEAVTSTVSGSSADQTYSAENAAVAEALVAFAEALRKGDAVDAAVLGSALKNAAVKIRTLSYVSDQLINALGVYAPKSFYEDVVPQTKAAADMGAHASWILRTVVPGST